MDRQAIAEDVVDLWDKVGEAYKKKNGAYPDEAVCISLFERAHTYIIHKNISAERQSSSQREEEGEELMATDKQIKFATDLGCKNAHAYTRKELSKWIEDNK